MANSKDTIFANLDSVRFSVYSVVGFIGFTLMASVFLSFFLIVPELAPQTLVETWKIRVIFAASALLAFCLIHLFSFAITKSSCIPLFITAFFGATASLFLFIDTTGKLVIPAIVMCGIGVAALATLWFCFVYTKTHRGIFPFLSSSVIIALGIALIQDQLFGLVSQFMVILLFFISLACVGFLFLTKPETYRPRNIDNKESDKRSKIMPTSAVMLAVTHFEFGFVVGMAQTEAIRIACFGAALAICALMLLDVTKWKFINERSIAPITTPTTVLAFLLLFLFGESGMLVGLGLITLLMTVYMISGIAALAEHARLSNLSLVRVFAKARFIDYSGILLGLIASVLANSVFNTGLIQAIQFSVVLAVGYGFIAAFCHKVRYPESSMVEIVAEPKGTKSIWLRRCKAVSEEHDLSDRQLEVLILMAQGRNARYIKQHLTISESTAQTHIRNIYRKTGVHSRQELLNLIESTKLYGEE